MVRWLLSGLDGSCTAVQVRWWHAVPVLHSIRWVWHVLRAPIFTTSWRQVSGRSARCLLNALLGCFPIFIPGWRLLSRALWCLLEMLLHLLHLMYLLINHLLPLLLMLLLLMLDIRILCASKTLCFLFRA